MARFGQSLAELEKSVPSLGALERVLPVGLVAETLAEAGRAGERERKLPPPVVVWLVVSMGLFRGLSIRNVLRRISDGLSTVLRWGPAEAPCSTAITHARERLGWEVVRTLFCRVSEALTEKHKAADSWRGFRVYALDGTSFLVPDSRSNDEAFGRPATSRGGAKSAYPRLRALVAVGVFTHLIRHATFDAFGVGELTLAHRLLPEIQKGSLLLMDELFTSYAWLAGLARRRVQFVVRGKEGPRLVRVRGVKGSTANDYRARLVVPNKLKGRKDLPDSLEVRVIKLSAPGREGKQREITLITSLLSKTKYPASKVADLYWARWEAELAYREIKTHQAAKQVTFRSQDPDRIRQEVWGLFLAYNCVRGLIADAAALNAVEPRRLSFVDCLTRIRTAITSFPANDPVYGSERLLAELACYILPKRRVGRNNPRAVKIKFSKFPRKRPGSKVVARSRDAR